MAAQIGLGLEIAAMARQEIEDGAEPAEAFYGLVRQCLNRDADWKAFYVEQMGKVRPSGANDQVLRLYAAELAAEEAHQGGDYSSASEGLQKLLDSGAVNIDDKGWYLQEMARYNYRSNRTESQRLPSSGSQKQPLVAEAAVRSHCRETDHPQSRTRRAHR